MQALNIFRQIGDISGEAITCFNVAHILEGAGKIEGAVRLVERTVEVFRKIQNPNLEVAIRYLGELKGKLGK